MQSPAEPSPPVVAAPAGRRLIRRLPVAAAACALAAGLFACAAGAQDGPAAERPAAPATRPDADAAGGKVGRLPHVEFDVGKRQVRVECEALNVNAPLEFFVCNAGGPEHEAVLRTRAKPSHVHTGLLAVGLKPGQPITFLEATKKWLPPQGPPLHITVEFQKDGRTVSYPAYRWLRDIKTKREARAFTWIFAGSRVTRDGRYGADDTGYIVTLVNFDFAMIDVPNLASNSNETLEWERNAELMPEKGAQVWLVIEPAGRAAGADAAPGGDPTQVPGGSPDQIPGGGRTPATRPTTGRLTDVEVDEQKIKAWVDMHERAMGPRADAIRQAAEAHYKVIAELRKEQQRLITEADRIQRAIDELERKWADVVTPRPELDPAAPPAVAPPGQP